MNLKPLAAAVLALLCCVAPADAQAVKVRFHDGLVSLAAQNAPLRTILAGWARMGGTTIVNGERVAGAPLTLELNGVPERQAIDILLRTVSGYLAALRPAGKLGVAMYDRILILATSTVPRNPAPQPAGAQARPQPPPQPQQPMLVPVPADPDNLDAQDDDPRPVAPFPRPGGPGRPGPFGPPQQPPEPDEAQPQAATPPTAGNPFGVPTGATSRPGVITPVPQARPQPTTRPNPSR